MAQPLSLADSMLAPNAAGENVAPVKWWRPAPSRRCLRVAVLTVARIVGGGADLVACGALGLLAVQAQLWRNVFLRFILEDSCFGGPLGNERLATGRGLLLLLQLRRLWHRDVAGA